MFNGAQLRRLVLVHITLLGIFGGTVAWADLESSDSSCGQITVDCSAHKISFPGIDELASGTCTDPETIDCGNSTVNGSGNIGGAHNGPIVPDGIEIDNLPGMGASGGEKVFHTANPQNESSCPSGSDKSRGCIHVCKSVLDKLKSCKGASLKITGAKGEENGNDFRDPTSPGGSSRSGGTSAMLDGGSWFEGFAMRTSLNHWLALGGLVQCAANASESRDLVNTFIMQKNQMIDVRSYDVATRTFEVVNLKYWGQGPLIVTPEELVKSVPAINLKRLLRRPSAIVRNQYMTDRDMLLLMPILKEARRGKVAQR